MELSCWPAAHGLASLDVDCLTALVSTPMKRLSAMLINKFSVFLGIHAIHQSESRSSVSSCAAIQHPVSRVAKSDSAATSGA